jgi:hypothetical protein
MNEGLDESRLVLRESLAIAGVYGDVREGGCAVVLDVNIGRLEELNKDGYGACVDELLSVFIFMCQPDYVLDMVYFFPYLT